MIIPLRPVVANWQCQRSGECCEAVARIVMTTSEQDELLAACPSIVGRWEPHPIAGYVQLCGEPCPYFVRDGTGLGVCRVHAVRPFNCRRFGCFRPDVRVEALDLDAGPFGCANLRDRLPAVAAEADRLQRDAMPWALAHQWTTL